MAWACIHCGYLIFAVGTTRCPNCEMDPYEAKPEELFIFNPRKIGFLQKKG